VFLFGFGGGCGGGGCESENVLTIVLQERSGELLGTLVFVRALRGDDTELIVRLNVDGMVGLDLHLGFISIMGSSLTYTPNKWQIFWLNTPITSVSK
jgi:hypothetical protein